MTTHQTPQILEVTKLASIGIGSGKTPSTEDNASIKAALQTGIIEGQKMIDAQVANGGTNVNGWRYAIPTGDYGTDYLFRAAVTQLGVVLPYIGDNIAYQHGLHFCQEVYSYRNQNKV